MSKCKDDLLTEVFFATDFTASSYHCCVKITSPLRTTISQFSFYRQDLQIGDRQVGEFTLLSFIVLSYTMARFRLNYISCRLPFLLSLKFIL